MGIRAVIFDLGGVLFTLGSEGYKREVARRLGLGDALPPAYDRLIPQMERGEIAEQEVWRMLSGKVVETTAFDDAWIAHFPVNREMLDLAADLRRMGLRTGVISNTQPSHVAIMRRLGVLEGFDPVLMSCEVGCRKPEEAIYLLALHRLGLPADQVAFVDDLPENVDAARRLGIHGLLHQGDVAATRRALLALAAPPELAGA